ncbi:hypothetical protein QEZ54_12490 [Catellatospora sp. KI3]|uniref:hypothetical protein n=1 Tax=Catellatospora sp. KI3 TaxID=3041620 RepID=UPI0024829CD2|nr:hypothetical protein [Catellatospora sp. KI3]MDI1461793.1 hypothetical protein [Catellatospora sp. KI3]
MPVEPMPTGEYRVIQQRTAAPTEASAVAATVDYSAPEQSETLTVGDFRLLAMVVGAAGAGAIAATSDDHTMVFLLLAALLGAAAGEAFGFGLSRWAEVVRLHRVVRWRVWLSVLTVLVIACTLVALTPVLVPGTPGTNNLTERGIGLSAVAIGGGLSSAATLAAVKQVASFRLAGTPGQQLDALLRLRTMCTRMLSQLGILVLLVMGVNAAATGFGAKLDTGVVLFSGVVASFVVGTMYTPTAAMLRRRGALFMAEHFSLADVPAAELVDAAENKAKLEKMLGLDQTTIGELKAALVVLSPIVVGLIATTLQQYIK